MITILLKLDKPPKLHSYSITILTEQLPAMKDGSRPRSSKLAVSVQLAAVTTLFIAVRVSMKVTGALG